MWIPMCWILFCFNYRSVGDSKLDLLSG
jgi:hypothetical protein